jgi:heme o synthase
METLRKYYAALKPERTYANVMTASAGFLFACRWHIAWGLFLALLIGTTFVVMSACGINNCMDHTLDAQMPRTKKRPTVTGDVSVRKLAILAVLLGIAGFIILAVWVNSLTVLLGAIGYLDYIVLYGWSKRTTPWSTLIGTISGAVPLVAGYTAVTGRFDITALALGLIMVFWQMPHFYAIGIFRLKDYIAGGLPIWPVRYGIRNTQIWMIAYALLYLLAVILLACVGSVNIVFTIGAAVLGVYWVWLGVRGLSSRLPEKWARNMFGFSLVVLLAMSAGLSVARIK